MYFLTCSQVLWWFFRLFFFFFCKAVHYEIAAHLFPLLLRKLLLWNEDEYRCASMKVWLSCSTNEAFLFLYAFSAFLAHSWALWMTGPVVPVACIRGSRQIVPSCNATWEVLLRWPTFPFLWQWSDHSPGSVPLSTEICHHKLNHLKAVLVQRQN